MSTYYMNEGAFDLLDGGFVDRTVHDMEARLEGGDVLGFAVTRARIPPDKSLRELVEGHVAEERKKHEGFGIIQHLEAEVAGAPAISLRLRWREEGRVVYRHEAHLAVFDAWMVFAMTAPLAQHERCDAELGAILASVRLRD